MATITSRKRKDGSVGYTAQIRIKKEGKIIHTESETFDRSSAAKSWAAIREESLKKPGAINKAKTPTATLSDAIDRYLREANEIGKTKAQVLGSLKEYAIANMPCSAITKADVTALIDELQEGRQPQTVSNYMSHLQSVFVTASRGWGFDLDMEVIKGPLFVARRQGRIAKSNSRERRPTLDEIDRLLTLFVEKKAARPQSGPMAQIMAFAMFSTRRQEEITLLQWEDLDEKHGRILVRNMKHPGQKIGNNVWCDLPPEAMAIIKAMPRNGKRIFPYSTYAISAAFTRACQFLGIEDLRFHDLRHEGISRQFEMGKTIPQVGPISGHRTWNSLQRYAQIRQSGDKFDGWPWLQKLTEK